MSGLIIRRMAEAAVMLWLVTVFVFLGTQLLPGDVAQAVLGQSATPETLAALRDKMGLTEPPVFRYLYWVGGLLVGNLGTSLASGTPIATLISTRLINTLLLAGITALTAVPIAITLGLASAIHRGGILDRSIAFATMIVVAIPEFLVATLLVMIFAVRLRWLPAVSYTVDFSSFGQIFRALALPVSTLTLIVLAQMVRMTRSTVINILNTPYIEMATLKGTRRRRIIFRHALANAIGPIANVVAINLAWLVSGVVIVETIFAYPGLAKLIVDGVSTRDFPVIQGCALIFCSAYIVLILIADIAAILANPRLRKPEG